MQAKDEDRTGSARALDDMIRLAHGWRFAAVLKNRLNEGGALITRRDIHEVIQTRLGGAQFPFKPLAQVRENGLGDISHALVLMPRGEHAMVRDLRAKHPDRPIVSVQYEMAPLIVQQDFRMQMKGTPKPATHKSFPFILLSTPGADSGYVASLLAGAGYPNAIELLTPAHVAAANWARDFSPARVLGSARRWRKSTHPPMALHIQADVLFGLIDAGVLDSEMVHKWLVAQETPILYVSRRDKLFQTGLYRAMYGRAFRSFLDAPPKRPPELKTVEGPTGAFETIAQLSAMEERMEAWLKPVEGQVKMFLFEDALEEPGRLLEELALSLGKPKLPEGKVPSYLEKLAERAWLLDEARALRRNLIDRLGLRINAEGSAETETDRIIRRLQG